MTDGSPAVARWIRRELASDPPRAPSLIVTVWGDALAPHGSEFWLATLFALLAPFSINERAVRTGVYRLHRGAWLEPRAVGRRSRYRLTDTGAQGFELAFHRVYDSPFRRWSGEWQAVIVGSDAGGPALRKRVRDELAWAGFGRFAATTFLRPMRDDDAVERIARSLDVRAALTAFEARDALRRALPDLRSRVESVWSLAEVAADYRRFVARFGALAGARPDASPEQAFVVRTLLVHAYRRVRLRDPQLPRKLLAADWPGAAAHDTARSVYRAMLASSEAFVREVLASQHEPVPARRAPASRFDRGA